MEARERSRRNLAIFWLVLIGLPLVVGWTTIVWLAFDVATQSTMS